MKLSPWPCCLIDTEVSHAKKSLKATSQMVQLLSTVYSVFSEKPLKVIQCAVVKAADNDNKSFDATKKKSSFKKKKEERKSTILTAFCARLANSFTLERDNDSPLYIPMASSQSDHRVACAWQLDRQLHCQLRSFKSRQFN